MNAPTSEQFGIQKYLNQRGWLNADAHALALVFWKKHIMGITDPKMVRSWKHIAPDIQRRWPEFVEFVNTHPSPK